MQIVKTRKKRGIKLNGDLSFDLCECCYAPYCDPMARHPKVEKRLYAGVCPACGEPLDLCKCKSKSGENTIRIHNNKKARQYRARRLQIIKMIEQIYDKNQLNQNIVMLKTSILKLKTKDKKSVQNVIEQLELNKNNMTENEFNQLYNAIQTHINKSKWLIT